MRQRNHPDISRAKNEKGRQMNERSYRVSKGKRMNSGIIQLRSGLAIRCIAAGLLSTIVLEPIITNAAERSELAVSALEFGGSIGNLLWVAEKARSRVTTSEANEYEKLAYTVKEQIELGRASSSLVKANFDLIGTTLAYSATIDPEPLSKATVYPCCLGSKKDR
jgi:hypothetical protein